jgi:hypothetical protein
VTSWELVISGILRQTGCIELISNDFLLTRTSNRPCPRVLVRSTQQTEVNAPLSQRTLDQAMKPERGSEIPPEITCRDRHVLIPQIIDRNGCAVRMSCALQSPETSGHKLTESKISLLRTINAGPTAM